MLVQEMKNAVQTLYSYLAEHKQVLNTVVCDSMHSVGLVARIQRKCAYLEIELYQIVSVIKEFVPDVIPCDMMYCKKIGMIGDFVPNIVSDEREDIVDEFDLDLEDSDVEELEGYHYN